MKQILCAFVFVLFGSFFANAQMGGMGAVHFSPPPVHTTTVPNTTPKVHTAPRTEHVHTRVQTNPANPGAVVDPKKKKKKKKSKETADTPKQD